MKWIVTAQKDIFVVVTSENFTAADCNRIQDELLSRADWRPGANVLLDYRNADFEGVGVRDLEDIGRHHAGIKHLWGTGRMALLMKPGRDFGLARKYEMLNESAVSSAMMVFHDEAAAREWLTESNG